MNQPASGLPAKLPPPFERPPNSDPLTNCDNPLRLPNSRATVTSTKSPPQANDPPQPPANTAPSPPDSAHTPEPNCTYDGTPAPSLSAHKPSLQVRDQTLHLAQSQTRPRKHLDLRMPRIQTVLSVIILNSSNSFSPGRMPVNSIRTSSSGLSPDSRIKLRARHAKSRILRLNPGETS